MMDTTQISRDVCEGFFDRERGWDGDGLAEEVVRLRSREGALFGWANTRPGQVCRVWPTMQEAVRNAKAEHDRVAVPVYERGGPYAAP